MAAATAQDMAGFTTDLVVVATLDLDDDDPLLLAFLTVGVGLLMDVFEVLLGADACVVDDDDDNAADDVQWTGGLGKAVGAGAS